MAVTCSTPASLYQIAWKCMEKGNSAGEGESWDCERTATPANWAVRGPVGNEQCRQEIKEWERGSGKGLKSAEVGRPPATCAAAEDAARELEADGGKVTQSSLPSFPLLECFSAPRNTSCHTLPPNSYPSSLPLSFVSHFSHLTFTLTQNNRTGFTSISSWNYKEGQTILCHGRVLST